MAWRPNVAEGAVQQRKGVALIGAGGHVAAVGPRSDQQPHRVAALFESGVVLQHIRNGVHPAAAQMDDRRQIGGVGPIVHLCPVLVVGLVGDPVLVIRDPITGGDRVSGGDRQPVAGAG